MRHSTSASAASFLGILLSLSAALVPIGIGCSEDQPALALRASSRPPLPPPDPVAPAGSEAPPAPSLTLVDVAGRVAGDRDEPVIGRSVTIVDRSGKRFEGITGEAGELIVQGVAPPYDVLVAPAPSGAVVTPLAFLGLTRRDPRLEVFEREGPLTRPASQTIKVGVRLPPCRASVGACWVSAVTASASGSGATAISYIEGTAFALLEIDHAWNEESTRAGETVNLHVLVGSADYAEYSYAALRALPAHPGEPMDVGMVSPARVDATTPVGLAAQSRNVPDGFQWTLSTWLDLPDGATFSLLYQWSPAASLRLPKLAGAALRVGAWVQRPPDENRPYSHRSAQAWSGTLPLATPNVVLDVPMGPEPLRPLADGQMSRHGLGFAWDASTPNGGTQMHALYTLAVADLGRGRQVVRAFGTEPEVAIDRLVALGLARPEPGEHVLDLVTLPGADVDSFTDPDVHTRRGRFSPTKPGSQTYQRFRFVVTP